ncbi:polysaccharide deacetylase family protein [Roseobacter sp. HKCCD9010]|uniref:polysaccharide deacetylase family protein n=1 Tax=unclassified Roseobacter TaxID=196798 RepID=UPI001491E8D8|nr:MULTISPECIES: polysaccharide deacetylase family protein [unclassified Roseobacter]MBF9050422.1 polysaccharide deacetylase family protein [Rhodobacterales bacterium HKCCD4356]NNV12161.1 polysaccharide deacetylase family protein [Roseobacter sp. HKCCD7357]NNV17175.1 polysaccharide deacetylase family protein [Roseobacter sp. HKCCD8768]NNV26404.1 polysaccharide deacetylase family protein [Roseobacter sp. HKCCD8192]NNV30899.1 polysaccharide deacetylase family protein [Roseobacter sp. HKCCD9061]
MTRDLIGYGGAWPDLTWPGGHKLAVSVVVNVEEGAEQQVLDGDPISERIGEVLSVVPEGKPDPGQAQIFAYGTRAGAWRMADALRRHRVPATLFACGRAAERVGPVLRMLARDGHETACHGWLWRPHADYDSPEAEAVDLDRADVAIAAATGDVPRGFFCRGAESPWTRSLLAERGYLYTSNGFDDDLPYRDGSGLIVVPYALDANDMKFFHPNGFVRASDMVDYVTDALDVLEAEAARGMPRLLNIGFHLRIVGRPGRFKAFEQVLAELDRRRDRLWLARRIEIAEVFDWACPA